MIGTNRRFLLVQPGYQGHIPGMVDPREFWASKIVRTGGYIPGYAGHVAGLQAEGLIGSSFGQLTTNARLGLAEEVDGKTEFQIAFEHPKTIAKVKARSVTVGKPRYNYLKASDEEILAYANQFLKPLKENNQNNQSHNLENSQNLENFQLAENADNEETVDDFKTANILKEKRNPSNLFRLKKVKDRKDKHFYVPKNLKPPINFIQEAIPGYAGHRRKMISENIYGLTFADSEDVALKFVKQETLIKQGTIAAHEHLMFEKTGKITY